ncbi:glycerate kinase [Mycolicibacterium sp.]|uniref:glycerate kinase n=1 Tax=Mycolicibacterium sp. TaxID=2320850 RepID=UPI0037C5B615
MLLALDKFKGSLSAAEVATALRAGMVSHCPDLPIDLHPVADGGDGTIAALTDDQARSVQVTVNGPTGAQVRSSYLSRGQVAVLELASTCGLSRLPDGVLAPMTSSTFGLGQLIRHAIIQGHRRLIVGVGGSASTDGGAGMLAALGAVIHTSTEGIHWGAVGLESVTSVDLRPARELTDRVDLVFAADVTNPLLGRDGAAHVYGPHRGEVSAGSPRRDLAE